MAMIVMLKWVLDSKGWAMDMVWRSGSGRSRRPVVVLDALIHRREAPEDGSEWVTRTIRAPPWGGRAI